MKKLLYAVAALGMISFSSCSNDELPIDPAANDGSVSFTVALPEDAITSRAFAEGEYADVLYCAVYDANTKALVWNDSVFGQKSPFNVTVNLVTGKDYDFVFWADNGTKSPYIFNAADKAVYVSYENALCNDDTRDAFYNCVPGIRVNGSQQRDVVLRRPLAQINVGTNDIPEAEKVKISHESTAIKVIGAHNQLNLLDGTACNIGGEDAVVEANFGAATLAGEGNFPYQDENPDAAKYDYLAMAYVLTGVALEEEYADTDEVYQHAQSELIKVEITLNARDSKDEVFSQPVIPVENVPVQRNYQTNIYGSLLTSPQNWNVIVEPGFFANLNKLAFINTTEAFWDAINRGDEKIILGGDIDAGKQIVIGNIPLKEIDLNGNTLTLRSSDVNLAGISLAYRNAELTINGGESKPGKIVSSGCRDAISVAYGKLDVNNVEIVNTYANAGYAIQGTNITLKDVTIKTQNGAVHTNNNEFVAENCKFIQDYNYNSAYQKIEPVINSPMTNMIFGQGPSNVTMKNCLVVGYGRGLSMPSGFSVNDVVLEDCVFANFHKDTKGIADTEPIYIATPGNRTITNTKAYSEGSPALIAYETDEDLAKCTITNFVSNSGLSLYQLNVGNLDLTDKTTDVNKTLIIPNPLGKNTTVTLTKQISL